MNAHAIVGPFTQDFNTAAIANQINQGNFAQLPIVDGRIHLNANQALYMYGGRKSLATAITDAGEFRTLGPNWGDMALFRRVRKVAGGTKTKQLLVITPVPNGIPAALRPYLIRVGSDRAETFSSIHGWMLKQTSRICPNDQPYAQTVFDNLGIAPEQPNNQPVRP